MLKHASALALSLSVMSLAAAPALAQAKAAPAKPTSAPAKPAAAPVRPAAPVVVAQATAPALSAASLAKKTFEFSLMGGYRFMHGNAQGLGSVSSNTTTNNVNNSDPATPPVTNSTVNTSNRKQSNVSNSLQHGFSLSGSATYWLDQSFGLGLDYTFAHTGARLVTFHSLGLETMNVVNPDDAAVAGTKSDATTYVTNFSSSNVSVTTSNAFAQPAGAGGEKFRVTTARITSFPVTVNFTADNAGVVGAAGNTFINSEKAIPDAADTTSNKFSAKGKIGESAETATTMHMADALTKTVIGSNGRGELHLLAGVSVPVIFQRSVTTSVIAGENGTGAATQKVEFIDKNTSTNNFTQDISVEAKRQLETANLSTMVGPMIGLGGTFKVNDGVRLYGKFGYTPIMVGNRTTSSTTTEFSKVVTTYTDPGSTSGKTGGSTTNENSNTTVSGDFYSTANSTATSFVLGASLSLSDSLGLNVEGVNQIVAGFGYTGLNAGVSLGF